MRDDDRPRRRRERDDYREDRPTDKQKNQTRTLWIAIGIGGGVLVLAMLVGGVLLAWSFARSSNQPAIAVDLAVLIDEWKANPVATKEKYRDKTVSVTGYVREIDTNFSRQTYIILSADKNVGLREPTAQIFLLDQSIVSQMAKYPKGSRLTIHISVDRQPDSDFRARAICIP